MQRYRPDKGTTLFLDGFVRTMIVVKTTSQCQVITIITLVLPARQGHHTLPERVCTDDDSGEDDPTVSG